MSGSKYTDYSSSPSRGSFSDLDLDTSVFTQTNSKCYVSQPAKEQVTDSRQIQVSQFSKEENLRIESIILTHAGGASVADEEMALGESERLLITWAARLELEAANLRQSLHHDRADKVDALETSNRDLWNRIRWMEKEMQNTKESATSIMNVLKHTVEVEVEKRTNLLVEPFQTLQQDMVHSSRQVFKQLSEMMLKLIDDMNVLSVGNEEQYNNLRRIEESHLELQRKVSEQTLSANQISELKSRIYRLENWSTKIATHNNAFAASMDSFLQDYNSSKQTIERLIGTHNTHHPMYPKNSKQTTYQQETIPTLPQCKQVNCMHEKQKQRGTPAKSKRGRPAGKGRPTKKNTSAFIAAANQRSLALASLHTLQLHHYANLPIDNTFLPEFSFRITRSMTKPFPDSQNLEVNTNHSPGIKTYKRRPKTLGRSG